MAYMKETFVAPGIIEIKRYHTYRLGGRATRKENSRATPEQIQKNNSRRAREKLYRLIATNFTRDDIRLDLTYGGEEPTPEKAKEDIRKFIRKLRKLYKSKGLELKYIYVTEHVGHRVHHHLLINFIPCKRSELQALWPYSKFNYRSMRDYDGTPEDARRVAEYLTKETDETIRDPKAIQKQRWCASKNLKQPKVHKQKIRARRWNEQPKPLPGYQLVDLYNGITMDGYPFQSYRQLDLSVNEVWPRK